MVSDGIDVVVGVSKTLLERTPRRGDMDVKHVLAKWKDEGLIHKLYVFDTDYIINIIRNSGLWGGVFNKLFLFNITEYDKLIQLDSDVLLRRNIRHWFNYDTPCAIQANDNLEWNSGAMVITPNQTLFDDLIAKLPFVKKKGKVNLTEPDNWNSGHGQQGFLSSYFTTGVYPALRMKTMPTENAVLISSLERDQYHYFWYWRNHIFDTVHLTVQKPWNGRTKPRSPLVCQVLHEWNSSTAGMEHYNMSISHDYLQNCPNASAVS